jgi:NTP pyrophosphatase (non-canonical NTP hydrolase)
MTPVHLFVAVALGIPAGLSLTGGLMWLLRGSDPEIAEALAPEASKPADGGRSDRVDRFLLDTRTELHRAHRLHPDPQPSFHHGYAVIAEEVDELWDEVKKKSRDRDHQAMRAELVQIAAMATRMAIEVVEPKITETATTTP